MTDRLQRLLDKDEIRDVMARYARGVDRRDWEAVRSVFFEDGTDHHTDFKGLRDAFIDWVSAKHAQVAKSQHFLGNSMIEFADDRVALVETYFQAVLELGSEAQAHRAMLLREGEEAAPAGGRTRVEVLGRYVDRFEKRDGAWRIKERRVVFDATHSEPNVGSVDENSSWVLGRRDAQDPVYIMRREAGLAD